MCTQGWALNGEYPVLGSTHASSEVVGGRRAVGAQPRRHRDCGHHYYCTVHVVYMNVVNMITMMTLFRLPCSLLSWSRRSVHRLERRCHQIAWKDGVCMHTHATKSSWNDGAMPAMPAMPRTQRCVPPSLQRRPCWRLTCVRTHVSVHQT